MMKHIFNPNEYFSKLLLIIFFSTYITFTLTSQSSFSLTNHLLKDNYYSGIAMGVADMNGDHLDDLIILDKAKDLFIVFQREDGHYYKPVSFNQKYDNTHAYSMCIGDINNDFINDFILGYATGGNAYLNLVDSSKFIFTTAFDIFVQGANFIDFDSDGLLDLFISNDISLNKLYKNNGNGFTLQPDWIDFKTSIPSDNSGNYGSEWIDIDNDCDLDLYISKCRAGVLTPTDPRRINVLYINDGNNNYVESANSYGLATGAQSWSTNFGDLDNDGDMDAFIVNHDDYFMLFENKLESNNFVLVEDYLQAPLFALGFEGMMCDFNNDTYLDILITGEKDFLLVNEGNLKFSIIEEPFGIQDIHSLAIGDLNNDGFMDVFTSYATGINEPSNYKDKIYLNDGNNNNYIKFTLTGLDNNRNAIGARISLFGAWGKQIREIKAGESYGIANSFTQHFGMKNANTIDSVVIRWPDCNEKTFYNLVGNNHYFITENDCITTRENIQIIGDINLCQTDSVTLIAGEGSQYYWSNGETTQSITTQIRASYFCRYINTEGCLTWTNSLDVSYSDLLPPTISTSSNTTKCLGDQIVLNTEEADGYFWSNGETTQSITISQSGAYSVLTQHGCYDFISDTISLLFLDTSRAIVQHDTIEKNQKAYLFAYGDSIFWYENEFANEPFHIGETFETPILESSVNYYVTNRNYKIFNSQYVGLKDINKDDSLLYSNNGINATMIFDVLSPTLIKSVKVRTDISGMRKIELINKQGIIIDSKEIQIESGTSRIPLDFIIPIGENYELTTNKNFNQAQLGFIAPRLWRENFKVIYPYEIENLISIKSSDKGTIYFYYFLDWEVQHAPFYCESEKTLVAAIVDTTVNVLNLIGTDLIFEIFPNPVEDILYISSEKQIDNYKIFNHLGKLVSSDSINKSSTEINIKKLFPGVYYLACEINGNWYYRKIIKI